MPPLYLAAKQSSMFGSKIWRNRFTSLLVALIPIHWSSHLSSSEALLISARPYQSLAASSGSNVLLQCSQYQNRSIRCYSTSGSPVSDIELSSDLAHNIRESYKEKETDGILELAVSSSMMIDADLDIETDLIPAILEATRGNKGATASIMNAMIGSSIISVTPAESTKNDSDSDSVDEDKLSLMSDRILLLMEVLQETSDIAPDIVTSSLAYRAMLTDPDAHDLANTVLEQAERRSKKIAGGKRRKLLASARRKKISSFVEAQEDLKDLLGSDFKVLLETDDFAVVNKPSGVLTVPGINSNPCMLTLLHQEYKEYQGY